MATVNADTWATELGVLSRARPRLITTGREVEAGTSGGVSRMGTGAALAGAAVIALFAAGANLLGAIFGGAPGSAPAPLAIAAVVVALLVFTTSAGLLGSLFDSLLGASVQAIYYCDACGKETERYPAHKCGGPTRPLRGWRWLDNDWVNFLSSVLGAAVAAGAWLALMGWR